MKFTIHSKHNIETNKYILHPSGDVEALMAPMEPHFHHIENSEKGENENVLSFDRDRRLSNCTYDDISGCKKLPETMEMKLKVRIFTITYK